MTNSSQFDGQVHWPVMHVATQVLQHVRQAREKALGKAD